MLALRDSNLAADDFVPLRAAFDMLGKHLCGPLWANDMATVVRLGQRGTNPEGHARGRQVLRALVQCVENGWLPLLYFVDHRRVWYFENPAGPRLVALYPQPTDDGEGQIELEVGSIFPCMVNVSDFLGVLRTKYARPSAHRRGRPPRFLELDEVLGRYFAHNPTSTPNGLVIRDLGALLGDDQIPGKTTLHERINAARNRACSPILFGN
jgi:hypothetical protein